ncbi:ankyrin repeat domain-containing protein 33B [Erinaceus europaeus]|uniref:Ankyrin repeat domain-containing protein 33B n=1 Tax=Erinaceus europaeus TaxID=9365 RepID=A0A1S2ZTN2_ERIEU|nr:ankyrin repeat domain-containing protein 33B [Erinaceus europaeus]
MVLLAGPGLEGGGARCVSPPPAPREEPEDFEDLGDFSVLPDARSVASDDSFYPPSGEGERGAEPGLGEPVGCPEEEAPSLLSAAGANDVGLLRALVQRGPRAEEVQETDRNGRTGLIVACYHGFVDVVVVFAECPHVDVNWQDKEGNTALITAAQAGHTTITNYLLNYFPGLDLERRNVLGFTALMKAAMQGRTECIRALMLAGADIHARDPRRGLSSPEWAAFTGRGEAVQLIQRLLERPCAEQFRAHYRPELPQARELATKPAASKNCLQRLGDYLRSTLTPRSPCPGPQDGGALDHMVRMTTGLRSPAVAIACQTVCPQSPPCVGKRRLAVPEMLDNRETPGPGPGQDGQGASTGEPLRTLQGTPRASLPPSQLLSRPPHRRASLLPLLRRSSVRPGLVVPRVRVSKAPAPTFQPERAPGKAATKDNTHLQLPKWRYKEVKEEKRRAEEAQKQQLAAEAQEKRTPRWKKRT